MGTEEAFLILDRLLPNKLQDSMQLPTVRECVNKTSRHHIQAFIEFELIKLSTLVSVGGNLKDQQVPFLASELIDLYPHENIADFKMCFERGARGDYNKGDEKDIFRLDPIVIRRWMEKYLEDKYIFVEEYLSKEKEHFKKFQVSKPTPEEIMGIEDISAPGDYASPEKAKDYLNQMLKNLSSIEKKIPRPITSKEILQEGQVKPKKQNRQKLTNEQRMAIQNYFEMKQKISRAGHNFYKDNPNFRATELNTYTIGEFQVLAMTKSDAEAIYKKAHE
jgi:hypothetical protein